MQRIRWIKIEGGKERQTDRQRQTESHRDRERETERQRDRDTERQRDREGQRETERDNRASFFPERNLSFFNELSLATQTPNRVIRSGGEVRRTIFLIRHGESKWNEAVKEKNVAAMAHHDHPLNEEGIRQAEALNKSWKVRFNLFFKKKEKNGEKRERENRQWRLGNKTDTARKKSESE